MKQIIYKGRVTDKWITEDGKVFNSQGEELLLSDNGAGYFSVYLYTYRNDKNQLRSQREYIHRLMAMMFLENPENLPQVNHKDCNKATNHISNLEWTSRPDNIDHSHRNGRMQKRYEVGPVVPLTPEEVRDVYISVVTGKEGVAEAGRRIGRSRTTISSIINKRSRVDITDAIDKELETCKHTSTTCIAVNSPV